MRQIARLLALVICLLTAGFYIAYGEGDKIDIPGPPQGSSLDKGGSTKFGGKELRGKDYSSSASGEEIAGFYDYFFEQNEFEKVGDQNIGNVSSAVNELDLDAQTRDELKKSLPKIDIRRMQYKKGEQVAEVVISDETTGSRKVGIVQYLQPPGTPALDKTLPSVHDSFVADSIPKEDAPGEDLQTVPRPPKGVRWSVTNSGKNADVMYSTALSPQEAHDFYQATMPEYGWQLDKDASAGELLKAYNQKGRKLEMNIPQIFSDGEDLNKVVTDSVLLKYTNEAADAQVLITPNIMDKAQGCYVRIQYNERHNRADSGEAQ